MSYAENTNSSAQKIYSDKMQYRRIKFRSRSALTILEMIIALSIITIIFAAVLPQFRVILKGWDSRQASAEVLQNGRVLIDHIARNLSKAVKITDVSESTVAIGFIEFQDNDGNNWRYDVNDNNYVEFGLVGALSDLAGPVSSFTFTCYDACDLDTALDIATADINDIRYVEVETTVINSLSASQNKTFTPSAYLRTNDEEASDECDPNLVAWWKLDETSGLNAEDSSSNSNDGTLRNMAGTEWTDGIVGGALNFDGSNDYIAIQNLYYDSSNSYAEVSVTAWIRTSDGTNQIIASFDRNEYWRLEINGSGGGTGQIGWDVRTSSGQVDYGSTTRVDDGQWHHVAGVFDNGTLIIYIDGNPETPASGGSTFGRGVNTRYGFLGVGSEASTFDGGTGPNNYFNGDMDDVRIYDRALDANEISELASVNVTYETFTEAKVDSDDTSISIPTPAGGGAVTLLGSWETDTSDLAHTAEAGSNRALIFIAHEESTSGSPTLTSVTYGGQTMTKIIERSAVSGYGNYVAAFILDEAGIAAATSDTFAPTWSATTSSVSYASVFLSNVDQTTSIGATDSYGTTSSTPNPVTTSALSTNDGDMVILGATCGNNGSYTLNNGFTEGIDQSVGSFGHTGVTGHKAATGVDETPSATFDSTVNRQVIIGFVVQVIGVVSDIEGDLLIAAVATDGSTIISPPSGWTEINQGSFGGAVTLGAWWKLAEASESTSHEFTWSGDEQAYGWMMRFTGHDPDNPINDWAADGETSSTPTSPEVTTTVNNCIILRLGAFDNNDITENDTGLTGHTTITMDESGGSSTITLFQDGLESFDHWTTTTWNLTTTPSPHSGSYSAHADDSDTYLISDDIDTSAYSEFTIDFWYQLDDTENGDIYLYLYDGSNYDNYDDFSNDSENDWYSYQEEHPGQVTITDPQYLKTNFRIRFEASMNHWQENVWIDDVLVTAAANEMVSGGAGYVTQPASGDSGTADFALTSSNASQMITIAIAPADNSSADCGGTIYP